MQMAFGACCLVLRDQCFKGNFTQFCPYSLFTTNSILETKHISDKSDSDYWHCQQSVVNNSLTGSPAVTVDIEGSCPGQMWSSVGFSNLLICNMSCMKYVYLGGYVLNGLSRAQAVCTTDLFIDIYLI